MVLVVVAATEPDDLKVEAEDWTTVVSKPQGSVNINPVPTDGDQSLHVGNFDAGDFIEYAVEVPETSCYRAQYRISSVMGSDGFDILFDGEIVDSFRIPPNSNTWATFTRYYELNEGSQTLRMESLGNGFDVNWLKFNATQTADCEQSELVLIEAETFFSKKPDSEVKNEATTDEDLGLNVGFINPGDWMEYEINIIESGDYEISYRIANNSSSSSNVNILIDGNQADTIYAPITGDWQNWQTIEGGTISLETGQYVLALKRLMAV